MITAKEAVKNAIAYLQAVVPQVGTTTMVEEIDREGPNWSITLSYASPNTNPYGIALANAPREYKIFKVRGEDGEVLSMKIRTLR